MANDNVVLVDSSGGARNITLPAPSVGRVLKIKDNTGSAATNNITVLPNGSEDIDGASSKVISNNWGSVELVSDGTDWFLEVPAVNTSGVNTVGAYDSQASSANGLVISGSNIYAQSATSTNPYIQTHHLA